jgi:hypothetical protein
MKELAMRAISRPPYTPWQPIPFALVPAEPSILHRYRGAPYCFCIKDLTAKKQATRTICPRCSPTPHQPNPTSQQSTPEQDKQNDDRQWHSN